MSKPPTTFLLTKSSSAPAISASKNGPSPYSPLKAASARPRSILNPKSPARKLHSSLSNTASSPLTAPAGRSPTRGNKRVGILNRRRTVRVDPPSFNLFSAPFSLDAAIKGTLPSYASHSSSSRTSTATSDDVYGTALKSAWFFDIHEDTPEQEMTNLLQHSTCMLDISSDEECEQKLRRERADGRGKENIPPADDVSQTSTRRTTTTISEGGMEYEKPRVALGDLNVEDFYADGVDPSEVIIVPGDDEDGTVVNGEQPAAAPTNLATTDASTGDKIGIETTVEEEPSEPTTPAKLATLQPMEGTGESFDLWESSSAKEEGDGARSPTPMPASPASDDGERFGDEC